VLAPQSPVAWGSQAGGVATTTLTPQLKGVLSLLDALGRQYSIDPHRVYVAGQSDGGFAVWTLLATEPDRFAAAVILCGGGDAAEAPRVAHVPLWVFHGDADDVVPVSSARSLVRALTAGGGPPRYTEYHGVGHDVWTRAFDSKLVDWLFAQHS
jgi:predicted peptidase